MTTLRAAKHSAKNVSGATEIINTREIITQSVARHNQLWMFNKLLLSKMALKWLASSCTIKYDSINESYLKSTIASERESLTIYELIGHVNLYAIYKRFFILPQKKSFFFKFYFRTIALSASLLSKGT